MMEGRGVRGCEEGGWGRERRCEEKERVCF